VAVTSSAQALECWVTALTRVASHIREGNALERLPEGEAGLPSDLWRALNQVIDAVVTRDRGRKLQVDRENDVLLALEELAREQAETLARQNAELRQQNESLKQADRMKNEFLANISHELRTPLNAVIGFSDILLEGIAGELQPQQAEYVADVRRAGEHLLGMITDILDLAKFGAGRLKFEVRPLNLVATIREALEMTRPLALKKGQVIELRSDHPVHCIGDPVRILQIALNLMSNAVKFTPPSGLITLSVRSAGPVAVLVVKDTGIGIDPDDHHLIFEMFRQVDGSATREYPGTGLGLTLVKKFTEAMEGSVSLESKLGEGATFTVRFPAPQPAAELQGESGAP
jgi:signal transduction histidine kinase